MSEENIPNIEKDVDYTTAYADGFFVKIDDNFTYRLIFYQKDYDIEDSELKQKGKKRLLFEIRLPYQTLINFKQIYAKYESHTSLATMDPKVVSDEKYRQVWMEGWEELAKIFNDTEFPNKENREYTARVRYLFSRVLNDLNKEEPKNE